MQKSFLEMHNRKILSLILLASFGLSLLSVEWNRNLIHAGGVSTSIQILKGLVTPDLTPELLELALISTWKSLAYAVAGMSLAIVFAVIFGVLASGIMAGGNRSRGISITFFRSLLASMRAIHELVWAWLFVSATGLSPLAAIFALAIPYGGTLGRILADILNDVPKEPIKALEASGAGRLKVLFYGYLPMALVDMVSYTMYRFECAVRSATVMSFVGLGGLGYQIQISLADLNYHEVWTFVYFLIGLVVLIDFWSNQLRRRLVA